MMKRFALLACLTAAAGCLGSEEDDFGVGSTTEELVNPNGVRLNGVRLNGLELNGVRLNGVTLGGSTVSGITIQQSQLVGTRNGVTIKGQSWNSALFTGNLSDGTTISLRLDSSQTLAAPNGDTWAYGVSFLNKTTLGWQPLCGTDTTGAQVLSIMVPGVFNYQQGVVGGGGYTADATQITFACRATAIAKCIEFGYKYWKPLPGDSSKTLLNHMLTCTRVLRADYCGDGNSWTIDGTPINIYDNKSIQNDGATWPIEAEWTPSGANCMSPTNYERWQNVSATAPTCFAAKKLATCGVSTDFTTTSTLIMDEYFH